MYRILIVDDEAYIVKGLKAIIEKESGEEVEIETVCDGGAALEMILNSEAKTDLLITDIHMPKITGIMLLREIRERGFQSGRLSSAAIMILNMCALWRFWG